MWRSCVKHRDLSVASRSNSDLGDENGGFSFDYFHRRLIKINDLSTTFFSCRPNRVVSDCFF